MELTAILAFLCLFVIIIIALMGVAYYGIQRDVTYDDVVQNAASVDSAPASKSASATKKSKSSTAIKPSSHSNKKAAASSPNSSSTTANESQVSECAEEEAFPVEFLLSTKRLKNSASATYHHPQQQQVHQQIHAKKQQIGAETTTSSKNTTSSAKENQRPSTNVEKSSTTAKSPVAVKIEPQRSVIVTSPSSSKVNQASPFTEKVQSLPQQSAIKVKESKQQAMPLQQAAPMLQVVDDQQSKALIKELRDTIVNKTKQMEQLEQTNQGLMTENSR